MDTAIILRLPAARTTPTASATPTTRRHTPTPRASTLTEPISMDTAITILHRVTTTGRADSAIIEGIIIIALIHVFLVQFVTVVIAIITYFDVYVYH